MTEREENGGETYMKDLAERKGDKKGLGGKPAKEGGKGGGKGD